MTPITRMELMFPQVELTSVIEKMLHTEVDVNKDPQGTFCFAFTYSSGCQFFLWFQCPPPSLTTFLPRLPLTNGNSVGCGGTVNTYIPVLPSAHCVTDTGSTVLESRGHAGVIWNMAGAHLNVKLYVESSGWTLASKRSLSEPILLPLCTISWSLHKLMPFESMMPSSRLIL